MTKIISEDELLHEFKVLDLDEDGFISIGNLREALDNLEMDISDEGIEMMIALVDINGDGQIDYEEFVKLLSMIDTNENCKIEYDEFLAWKKSAIPVLDPKTYLYDIEKLVFKINELTCQK